MTSALYDYVAGYTTQVNDYLRKGQDEIAKPITTLMDRMIRKISQSTEEENGADCAITYGTEQT